MMIFIENDTYIMSSKSISFDEFIKKIYVKYKALEMNHLIIDISNFDNITISWDIFSELSKNQKLIKKSLVFILKKSTEVPDQYNFAPTLQEAHDIIELENIERDLGF